MEKVFKLEFFFSNDSVVSEILTDKKNLLIYISGYRIAQQQKTHTIEVEIP